MNDLYEIMEEEYFESESYSEEVGDPETFEDREEIQRENE